MCRRPRAHRAGISRPWPLVRTAAVTLSASRARALIRFRFVASRHERQLFCFDFPKAARHLPTQISYRTSPSRRLLDGWLSRRGLRLNVLLEADDHLVLRALIKEGIGFSLLTQG